MQTQTIIGIIASSLTTIAAIPQLIKIVKEKRAEDISILMLIVLLTGLASWITYGVLKDDLIIIVANSISFLIYTLIFYFTFRYKN